MKKPSIPSIPLDASNKDILVPLKEAVEIITGQRGQKLKLLTGQARVSDLVIKVNEIIRALQNPTEPEALTEVEPTPKITVSATAPPSPSVNDVWIDTN